MPTGYIRRNGGGICVWISVFSVEDLQGQCEVEAVGVCVSAVCVLFSYPKAAVDIAFFYSGTYSHLWEPVNL